MLCHLHANLYIDLQNFLNVPRKRESSENMSGQN